MSCIHVLALQAAGPGMVALARRRTARSLAWIIEKGVTSVGFSVDVGRWQSVGAVTQWRTVPVRLGLHLTAWGPTALLVAPSVSALIDTLRGSCEWDPYTSLWRWRFGVPMHSRDWDRLGEILDRYFVTNVSPAPGRRPPNGVVVAPDLGALGLREVRAGSAVEWAAADSDVTVRVDRMVSVEGHLVPRPVWTTVRPGEPSMTWWDGARFGVSSTLADLPARLRQTLDAIGTATDLTIVHSRPLTDYRPLFLVRQPALHERDDASPLPDAIRGPALLLEVERPIPLPPGLPVVAAPSAALAVVCRCSGRAFVPHADPLPVHDLRLAATPRWYIGGLPRMVLDA